MKAQRKSRGIALLSV